MIVFVCGFVRGKTQLDNYKVFSLKYVGLLWHEFDFQKFVAMLRKLTFCLLKLFGQSFGVHLLVNILTITISVGYDGITGAGGKSLLRWSTCCEAQSKATTTPLPAA